MTDKLYTPKELASLLSVTPQTLKQWEQEGKLKATKTKGGHRRYVYSNMTATTEHHAIKTSTTKKHLIYARVACRKQHECLEQQVQVLQTKYPEYEVITDIGSGIDFQRRGLVTLMDAVISGNVEAIAITHTNRICHIGFDMFKYIFDRFGVTLHVVSGVDVDEPVETLAKELFSIATAITSSTYGGGTSNKNRNMPIIVESERKTRKVRPKPMSCLRTKRRLILLGSSK